MAALMIFVLVAFLGMGTDVGYLLLRKRQMQNAADAGAMWAVQEIRRGNPGSVVATGEAGTSENLFPNGVPGVQVTVNYPPLSGDFVGDNLAVEVIICQQQRVFFITAVQISWAEQRRLLKTREKASPKGCSGDQVAALDKIEIMLLSQLGLHSRQ